MIMFPYAKDLEYKEQTLSFTIQFFDNSTISNISITIPLDTELSYLIEDYIYEDKELWND